MNKLDKLTHLKNEAFLESLRQEGRDEIKAVIDQFWDGLWNRYNIESREEIEKDTKESWAKGTSPLNVALHYIWKREPKVAELVGALQKIMSYTKLGIGSIARIREIASKPLKHRSKQ
jgi:ribonuclease HIII